MHITSLFNVTLSFGRNDIVLYRPKRLQNKFEESSVKYEGDTETYSLKAFITEN